MVICEEQQSVDLPTDEEILEQQKSDPLYQRVISRLRGETEQVPDVDEFLELDG
jgi:hypothetical protein